nr:hypothetical protein [Bartonella callosciuri]
MFFLHLFCKKENFFPFATWLLLSSFGMLLISHLEVYVHLIARSNAKNIITTNAFDLKDKRDKLNVTTTENKKLVTLPIDSVLSANIFQNIIALNLFLIMTIALCIRVGNLQTQYFSNKRAPPLS